MAHQVFISYSHRDCRIAEAIRDALEGRSIRCWMAPRDMGAGQFWEAQIVTALRSTPVVVLVFSRDSNDSPQVQREVTLSVHYRAQLLTYRIENVTPEESLEYCLCKSHWMDAFSPLEADALRTVCNAVETLLRTRTGAASPAPAVSPADRCRVLNLLVEEMLRQRGVVVRIDLWDKHDQEIVHALEAEGVLVERSSGFHPEQRFTTPATRSDCQRILAEWVAAHAARLTAEWRERSSQLPALSDGVAEFLAGQVDPAAHPLFRDLLPVDDASVGRVVTTLLACWPPGRVGLESLTEAVTARGGREAVCGLARGAKRLLESGRLDQAEPVYAAVQRWGEAGRGGDHSPRLLIELANEHGRLLRRRHRYPEAETQFRETLQRAVALGDPELAGIVANNLAGTLLDPAFLSESRWQEAVALLNDNEPRFSGAGQRRHRAVTCNLLGEAYSQRDPPRAESYFRSDAALCREEGDDCATVDALDRWAVFLTRQGRCAEAQSVHHEELLLCTKFPAPRSRARALANLGSSYLRAYTEQSDPRQLAEALQAFAASREAFSTLDEPRLAAPMLENYGHALRLSGADSEAVKILKECAGQYRRLPHTVHWAEQVEAEIEELESKRGES